MAVQWRMVATMLDKQQIQEDGYDFPYHYMDLRSEEYRLLLHLDYISRLKVVKDLLKPFVGQRVLDAGCGDGRFCYELKGENVEVVGVDFSERAVGFARAFSPEGEFYAQDLKDIKLPYQFDVVVFIETLEHIIPEEIPAVLDSLAKVMKPEGRLILTVPSVNIDLALVPKHFQHFSKESLEETLRGHFDVVEMTGHNKMRNVSLLARLFYWRLRGVGLWLYPFRRWKIVAKLYETLDAYFYANLITGEPDDCNGLVAVCRRV
jgi:SAM-dependent methyltransferase